MPPVGFEPTILVFERENTVLVSDCVAIVLGNYPRYEYIFVSGRSRICRQFLLFVVCLMTLSV
jgi:hypothetical protein